MSDQDQMMMDESLLKFFGGEVVQDITSSITHVVLLNPTTERLSYFQVYYNVEISVDIYLNLKASCLFWSPS